MIETYSDHNIELPSGASGDVRTTCPQCSPGRKKRDEKCLAVTVEKGTWFCHHCGWTGGLKAEKSARPIPAPKTRAFKLPKPYAQGKLPEKVLEWFKSRGISEDTLLDNRVGYGTAWMPQIEGETTTIQFPYMDGETVVNVKYRDGKKNFRMEKGAERVLYGLNHVGKDLLVWVEGEIDKLSLWEIGVESCVSVPDGAPSADSKNYSSKFAFLDSAQKRLDGVRRHIIAVDSDAPGARLKIELVRRIGPEKCWTVEWPEDCKDANEVLQKYGKDRLFDCVDEAKPVPVAGVFEVDDIRRDVMDIYQYGFERGMKTGWPDVDAYYTVRQREWSVVTGIPGHGKSEWLDALMVNMARDHGWRFGICSMENYPLSRHFAKLAEKYVGMPFENLRDFPKMPESELESALDWAQDHFFFLSPEDDDLTVDGVLKLARVLVYRHGINGLVLFRALGWL